MAIVTLTTDFGVSDHYVACMKGVILQIAPTTYLVDVTHQIERHDVVHAAVVLRQVFEFYPRGTIHVVVVDPGVGSTRRLLAMQYSGQFVLAPDNGIVSLVHRDMSLHEIRSIENRDLFRRHVSSTFHGRDILAPIAGFLAAGGVISNVGPPVTQLEILNLPKPVTLPDGGIEGQVLYCDRFGNLISNISKDDVKACMMRRSDAEVYVGALRIGPVRRTYSDVAPGEILSLLSSAGSLEIAINQDSAASRLRAGPGSSVIVR